MATKTIPFLTRDQIKTNIALGHVLVLHRSFVYKLNSWLSKHPGGELAILHFVGRDATDEIEAYHPESVIKQMRPFIIGQVVPDEWEDEKTGVGWRPLNPPVQIGLWPMPALDDNIQSETLDSVAETSTGLAVLDHTLGDSNPQSRTHPSDNLPTIHHASSSGLTRLDERLRALEPSLDPPEEALQEGYDLSLARQKHLSNSYRVLHDKIRAAGLYSAPRPFYGYGPDLIRYSVLFLAFFFDSPRIPPLDELLGQLTLPPNRSTSICGDPLNTPLFLLCRFPRAVVASNHLCCS